MPSGSYYLKELAVPEGYRLPARRTFGPYRITDRTDTLPVTLARHPDQPAGRAVQGRRLLQVALVLQSHFAIWFDGRARSTPGVL
ncbi:hypothetical protein [Streptomyces viridosporus]|uniref:hypothetical protein n=1 Tax=Streptomyces viridosporus TaxID=67581 RepID=UPI0033263747